MGWFSPSEMTAVKPPRGEVIYLDHNSTTPLLPPVVEAMRPFWAENFGNPASAHQTGRRARQALETARETIAALLDAEPDEVVFTSGATEANNLALFGLAGQPPAQILTSPVEHPSVAEPFAQLAKRGFTVQQLNVSPEGVVLPDSAAPYLSEGLRLAAVMLANNETGAIQPVAELAHRFCQGPAAAQRAPLVHCDAVQAVGKIPVSFGKLGVTTLSLSAHKFNGPRGIGGLLVRKGTRLTPLFWGGHQQRGLRPGTEPVALVVGLAAALQLAVREMDDRTARLRTLRGSFLSRLLRQCPPVVLNGPVESGLANTLNLSFPGCEATTLLMKLDLSGVACSTGSACSSGSLLPSAVLQAMACPPECLRSAMRFSLSHLHTENELVAATDRIAAVVCQLRAAGE